MSQKTRRLIILAFCLIPATALAGYVPGGAITISTGVSSSAQQIFTGLVNVLLRWSTLVSTGLFLLGAFIMVGAAGSEEGTISVSNGKKIMKAALIGLAIIAGSWLIISTTLTFIAS